MTYLVQVDINTLSGWDYFTVNTSAEMSEFISQHGLFKEVDGRQTYLFTDDMLVDLKDKFKFDPLLDERPDFVETSQATFIRFTTPQEGFEVVCP